MKPSFELMALLDKHGALSATEAGDMMHLSRSQMARKCRDLVTRGWARALSDPDDGRQIIYDLTRTGRNVLDQDDYYERRLNKVT